MAKAKKSTFLSEFKTFVMRGNVLDMAVGIVIGGAFTSIVTSVVQDIINPVIGLIIGRIDFAELKVVLVPATETAGEVAIRYGVLIQTIIQFLLTALVLFLIIRAANRMKEARNAEEKAAQAKAEAEAKAAEEKKKAEEAAAAAAAEVKVSEEVLLLRDIKALLEKKN